MPNVLPYHVGPEERYSLVFVNPDREAFEERLVEAAMERSSAVTAREVDLDGGEGEGALYAVYSDSVPESVVEGQSQEEIERILNDEFTSDQLRVLDVILYSFLGVVEETSQMTAYKEMTLPKIPEILEHPDWGSATVPEVAGQLLSRFVLAHPMPNANHRTAIGLVERYLNSYEESVSVPDTGEEGEWYAWAEPYVHESKRLLTLRRKARVFEYARGSGVDVVRRRNDVDIDLREYALDVENPYEHFAVEHESASVEFVRTILDESGADELVGVTDQGWETFAGELGKNQSGR